jgi:arginase
MPAITLIGAPWDGSSSFQRGAATAPPLIRQALWSPSSNAFNERGDDLSADAVLEDAGDMVLPDDAAGAREVIEQRVRLVLQSGRKPLTLGGDHAITYPVLRAFASRSEPPTVLHLDAHADLYDEFPAGRQDTGEAQAVSGDRYSHACTFARVMEERLAIRLIQAGIRTLNTHQRSQAGRLGVEVVGADRWRDVIPLLGRLRGPLYISIDLDVLEPMLAPGLSHPEPGGLTVRDVLEVLAAVRLPVIGADVVEYNPLNDVRDLTARVAAKFVKELVGVMRR